VTGLAALSVSYCNVPNLEEPMKRLLGAGLVALAVVVAAVFVWDRYVREDAPAAFELTDLSATDDPAVDSDEAGADNPGADGTPGSGDSTAEDMTDRTTAETAATENPTTETTAAPEAGPDPSDDGQESDGPVTLDGTWTVGEGSEAGYRVVEDLGEILDFEAVGRTSQVTGTIEVSGSMVTAANFEVDIASITSDDSRRDSRFSGAIMNSFEFPTATLTLAQPIELGVPPAEAQPQMATAIGELTLHGVTNAVTFPVEAQLTGNQIELVAAIDVIFADYGIANPSNPLAKVRDEGLVEVRLFLFRP